MFNLTRVSLTSIGLGVGLVLGGCAATVDEDGALVDDPVDESSAELTTMQAEDDATEGAATDADEADENADPDQKIWGVGFGRFGGFPGYGLGYGRFGGLGYGRFGGLGWGGYPGVGWGAGWGGYPGVGWGGYPGVGWGGLGWGRSVGWGTSISCMNGICF